MTLLHELFPSAYYAIPTVLAPNHVRNVGVICHQSEPEGRKKGKNSSRNSSKGTGSNSQIITANIHGKPSLCAMHDFLRFPCVHALFFTTAPCTQHYCVAYTTLLQPSMLPRGITVSEWLCRLFQTQETNPGSLTPGSLSGLWGVGENLRVVTFPPGTLKPHGVVLQRHEERCLEKQRNRDRKTDRDIV